MAPSRKTRKKVVDIRVFMVGLSDRRIAPLTDKFVFLLAVNETVQSLLFSLLGNIGLHFSFLDSETISQGVIKSIGSHSLGGETLSIFLVEQTF